MPGIKGQKWGVRRYQNEDGSLTPEGVTRYRTDAAAKAMTSGSKVLSDASKIGSGNKSINKITKDLSKMSDNELRDTVKRLNLEQDYARLTGNVKRVRSGSDWTREILQTSGIIVGMGASIASIVLALKDGRIIK